MLLDQLSYLTQQRDGSQPIWRQIVSLRKKSYNAAFLTRKFFPTLILLLGHFPDIAIHIAGDPSQVNRLHNFALALKTAGLKKITIEPPLLLSDFIQTIAEARLVLTVDTGTAHMACAVESPAVIICSGNQTGVWVPYSKNGLQKWLTPPDDLPKGEWRKYFSPSKVADSILEILAKSKSAARI